MAETFEVTAAGEAREIHQYLAKRMSHVEKVSEDIITRNGVYVAVMYFEHYFFRVSNQASLMVIVEGISAGKSRIKTVSCGTSQGMIFKFDWGAAADFAEEPIRYLREKYIVTPV